MAYRFYLGKPVLTTLGGMPHRDLPPGCDYMIGLDGLGSQGSVSAGDQQSSLFLQRDTATPLGAEYDLVGTHPDDPVTAQMRTKWSGHFASPPPNGAASTLAQQIFEQWVMMADPTGATSAPPLPIDSKGMVGLYLPGYSWHVLHYMGGSHRGANVVRTGRLAIAEAKIKDAWQRKYDEIRARSLTAGPDSEGVFLHERYLGGQALKFGYDIRDERQSQKFVDRMMKSSLKNDRVKKPKTSYDDTFSAFSGYTTHVGSFTASGGVLTAASTGWGRARYDSDLSTDDMLASEIVNTDTCVSTTLLAALTRCSAAADTCYMHGVLHYNTPQVLIRSYSVVAGVVSTIATNDPLKTTTSAPFTVLGNVDGGLVGTRYLDGSLAEIGAVYIQSSSISGNLRAGIGSYRDLAGDVVKYDSWHAEDYVTPTADTDRAARLINGGLVQ